MTDQLVDRLVNFIANGEWHGMKLPELRGKVAAILEDDIFLPASEVASKLNVEYEVIVRLIQRGEVSHKPHIHRKGAKLVSIQEVKKKLEEGRPKPLYEPLEEFEDKEYYSAVEAAKILGISYSAVHHRCHSGSLKCIKDPRLGRVIAKEEVLSLRNKLKAKRK